MRSVWICQISSAKNLMWFDLSQKFYCNSYIFLTHWFLLDCTCFIKWKILKMTVCIRYAHITASCLCLANSYQTFDGTDLGSVHLVRLFLAKIFTRFCQNIFRFFAVHAKHIFKTYGEIKKPR